MVFDKCGFPYLHSHGVPPGQPLRSVLTLTSKTMSHGMQDGRNKVSMYSTMCMMSFTIPAMCIFALCLISSVKLKCCHNTVTKTMAGH